MLKLYDFPNTCMYVNVYVYVCIHTFQLRYDTKCYETHVLLILPPFIGKYIEGTVCVNIYNMLGPPPHTHTHNLGLYYVNVILYVDRLFLLFLLFIVYPHTVYMYTLGE